MRTKTCLSLDDANAIMAAAKAAAAGRGWSVTIVVVDDAGIPIHIERMDGAPLKSVEIATLKGASAALMRRASKDIEEMAKARNGFLSVPNLLPVQGGLPVMAKGSCVGGVGVSGVQSHEDEEVARAGIAALNLG